MSFSENFHLIILNIKYKDFIFDITLHSTNAKN
jgi:hypothetical protein